MSTAYANTHIVHYMYLWLIGVLCLSGTKNVWDTLVNHPVHSGDKKADTHMALGLRLMSVLPHDLLERHSIHTECLSKWVVMEIQREAESTH